MGFLDDMLGAAQKLREVPFFGTKIGKAIEEWSNPITQLSDRNPMLAIVKGEGGITGSNKPNSGSEDSVNNANVIAALMYAGYGAGAAAAKAGAAGSGAEGAAGTVAEKAAASGAPQALTTEESVATGGSGSSGLMENLSNIPMPGSSQEQNPAREASQGYMDPSEIYFRNLIQRRNKNPYMKSYVISTGKEVT